MTGCIFCQIIKKDITTKILYEDDDIIAFPDINPQAPVHILVLPKKHIPNNLALTNDEERLLGRIFLVINKLAAEKGLTTGGFRVVNNCLKDGGQAVEHLHFHLLGGRPLLWPPG